MASSSSNNFISELSEKKYINVETYRKNGQSVLTPVWFAVFNNKIYFRTDSNSGKVKRIMNNQNVRIAGCDLLGNIKIEWIKANAKIAKEVDHETVNLLINKKYFIIQSFIKIMYTLRKIKVIIISIEFS